MGTIVTRRNTISVTVGVLLILLGAAIDLTADLLVRYMVKETVVLDPQAHLYKTWEELPFAIDATIYVFNVTNPEEYLTGCKPVLQELGPYVYRYHRRKKDIRYDEREDTFKYKQVREYHFVPEASERSQEDEVVVPNVPLMSAVTKLVYHEGSRVEMLGLISLLYLYEDQIFVRKKVRQLLFEGYFDSFLQTAQGLSGVEIIEDGIFGIFKDVNGTEKWEYEVYSGKTKRNQLGVIKSYNGSSSLPHWRGEDCNAINGSEPLIFPSWVSKNQELTAFMPDLCRSVHFQYEKEQVVKGIRSYRFVPPYSQFDSPTHNQDDSCYCRPDLPCYDAGFIDVSPCFFDAPVVLSYPHFSRSPKKNLRRVAGLKSKGRPFPNDFITVEPISGVVTALEISLQMNVDMPRVRFRGVGAFSHIPEMLFPVLWMNTSAQVSDEEASYIYTHMTIPLFLLSASVYFSFIVGGGLFIVVGIFIYRDRREKV